MGKERKCIFSNYHKYMLDNIVKYENIRYEEALNFIEANPNAEKSFRYFNKRNQIDFSKHLYNCILKKNSINIAYGHLDYDIKVWLGIFVADNHVGNGYAKLVMKTLIEKAIELNLEEIFLSVDSNNTNAIELYKKFDFIQIGVSEYETLFFKKKLIKI